MKNQERAEHRHSAPLWDSWWEYPTFGWVFYKLGISFPHFHFPATGVSGNTEGLCLICCQCAGAAGRAPFRGAETANSLFEDSSHLQKNCAHSAQKIFMKIYNIFCQEIHILGITRELKSRCCCCHGYVKGTGELLEELWGIQHSSVVCCWLPGNMEVG